LLEPLERAPRLLGAFVLEDPPSRLVESESIRVERGDAVAGAVAEVDEN
jgi:hypothetical protein